MLDETRNELFQTFRVQNDSQDEGGYSVDAKYDIFRNVPCKIALFIRSNDAAVHMKARVRK